jgi:NitT/TauT family transport system substrate-binding protein
MQANQIDGEIADLVAVALLKKGGTDVRVASLGLGAKPAEGRFALLAAPKGKVKSITDLKNIPVAISENSIIEYVTDNLLLNGGLKKEEIKKVAIPSIPARMEALSSGQIEAAVLPDPLATLAEKNGARVITDDTKINLSQTVLLFRTEVITENKTAVQKVVKVYGNAGQELTTNPDKYRSLLIEKARIPAPIKDTYKSPTFSLPQPPSNEQVAKVINWMTEKKLLEKPYTYADIVDSSLISK